MGDEDAVEDYMSEALLQQCTDVRPGLLSRTQKRKIKDRENHKDPPISKKKKFTIAENETRQQGLATPIAQDNKGFAMLEKMGYKKGAGIGKSSKGDAFLIPLVLKDGRTGLGRSSFIKEKETEKLVKKKEDEQQTLCDFLRRNQQAQISLKMELDFSRSQKACEQLDTQSGLRAPTVSWFWPHIDLQTDEPDDEDDSDEEDLDLSIDEKLATLTEYLRGEYYYCIWCGSSYESESNMALHCPGDTKEKHD